MEKNLYNESFYRLSFYTVYNSNSMLLEFWLKPVDAGQITDNMNSTHLQFKQFCVAKCLHDIL